MLSLWIQYHVGVYDTIEWLWSPFAAVGVLAGIAVLLVGVWRSLFGPRRRSMFGWVVVGILSLVLWAVLVGYMFFEQGRRNLPNTHFHKVGRMASVTLLKAHARIQFPYRLESDRLVMYYNDRIVQPADDMTAMDAHLTRLEMVLGRRQQSKIHWVRGSALGMSGMSIHSVALASHASPASDLDRHELAHSFLYQFSDRGGEPPMLLLEGWAMAMDGHDERLRRDNRPEPMAMTALDARKEFAIWQGTSNCLRAMLSPDMYHFGVSFAYEFGGPFVDFLLRRHGSEPFLTFYNGIHPDSIEADCERAFHCSIDELERAFWEDVELCVQKGKRPG